MYARGLNKAQNACTHENDKFPPAELFQSEDLNGLSFNPTIRNGLYEPRQTLERLKAELQRHHRKFSVSLEYGVLVVKFSPGHVNFEQVDQARKHLERTFAGADFEFRPTYNQNVINSDIETTLPEGIKLRRGCISHAYGGYVSVRIHVPIEKHALVEKWRDALERKHHIIISLDSAEQIERLHARLCKVADKTGLIKRRDALGSLLRIFHEKGPKFDLDVEKITREIARRHDGCDVRRISIDPLGTKDIDDLVYAHKKPNGNIHLEVSIIDLSSYLGPVDQISKHGLRRMYSIYGRQRMLAMLGPDCTAKLSLAPGGLRLAWTIRLEINKGGQIVKCNLIRNKVKNHRQYSYEEVNQALNDPQHEDAEMLRILNEARERLRKERVDRGGSKIDKYVDSHPLIEECMLAANRFMADYVYERFPDVAFFFRAHEIFNSRKRHEIIGKAKLLGVDFNIISSSKDDPIFWRCLLDQLRDIPGLGAKELSRQIADGLMNRARYQIEASQHSALAFERYMHFTSPLRRGPDAINAMILNAAMAGKKPLSQMQMNKLLDRCHGIESKARERCYRFITLERIERILTTVKKGEIFSAKTCLAPGGLLAVEIKGITKSLDEDDNRDGLLDPREIALRWPNHARVGGQSSKFHPERSYKVRFLGYDALQEKFAFEIVTPTLKTHAPNGVSETS